MVVLADWREVEEAVRPSEERAIREVSDGCAHANGLVGGEVEIERRLALLRQDLLTEGTVINIIFIHRSLD